MKTKRKGDKIENTMKSLGTNLEDGEKTFNAAIEAWNVKIAELEKEKVVQEAKLKDLDDKISDAKVNMHLHIDLQYWIKFIIHDSYHLGGQVCRSNIYY